MGTENLLELEEEQDGTLVERRMSEQLFGRARPDAIRRR